MKDKTNLKIIVAVIVSVIISSSITAFAAIKFQASEIGYNTTSVADALDSLYQTQFSDNYSTEEKVVGKWVDGKPIYQKTITDISIAFPWTSQKRGEASMDAVVNNVEHFISCILYTNTGAYIASIGQTSYGSSTWTILTNDPITATSMVIQYTKTTDQPIGN